MAHDGRSCLLRTLAFHATWRHAPTLAEWIQTLEIENGVATRLELIQEIQMLQERGEVKNLFGRFCLPGDDALIHDIRDQEQWMPRKRRAALRVAKWLAHIASVRFVALCNSTALGHARDEGDLDFFVITRAGTVMLTRGIAALPFKLFGQRPGNAHARDPVCLSYFVTDGALDVSSHMLLPDDPYFRYWFLSLLPLYDDGISDALWNANRVITRRHAFAERWITPPDFHVATPAVRFPVPRFMESHAARLQTSKLPPPIRDRMNRDTHVMVTPHVLKFHVDDGREDYRKIYEERCGQLGI